MPRKFDPASEALAFRIWQYCERREWNVSIADVAEALDEPVARVRGICTQRRWSTRMRKVAHRQLDLGRWEFSVLGGGTVAAALAQFRPDMAETV